MVEDDDDKDADVVEEFSRTSDGRHAGVVK